MTLTETIYNILNNAEDITILEKAAGVVPSKVEAKEGLLTFMPLPSAGVEFAVTTKITQYQFNIWHKEMLSAEAYKDEIVKYFNGLAGKYDNRSLIFTIDSDLGGIYEENGDIWHYILIINVRHNLLVS